ncbi:hypothetical protein [Parashewanella spongiae]|nr:hypothetical protein [Parashewanella spongiae]
MSKIFNNLSSGTYIPYGRHTKLAFNALSAFIGIVQERATQ